MIGEGVRPEWRDDVLMDVDAVGGCHDGLRR